jgi:hypothetical protein
MPVPKEVLAEIQRLLRKPREWFSAPEIQKRRPELFASEFVKTGTGEHFSVSHQPDQVRRDLESFAAVLLERELRRCESEIARVLADNSVTPSLEDDALLVNTLTDYVEAAVEEIQVPDPLSCWKDRLRITSTVVEGRRNRQKHHI